jgi:hypothetical protein
MIGRILDALLEIHALARVGLKVMQERNGGFPEPISMRVAGQVAKEIGALRSASGLPLRTSEVIEAESLPSIHDLPEEVTVSQIEPFLPWGDHEIRCKIRRGEIPILRARPYMLSRDQVLAIAASAQDRQGAA